MKISKIGNSSVKHKVYTNPSISTGHETQKILTGKNNENKNLQLPLTIK